VIAISVSSGTHNGIPVEGCMPNYIQIYDNTFIMPEGAKFERYCVGKAENVFIGGELVLKTKAGRPEPKAMLLLIPMDADGKLGIGERIPMH